MKDLPKFLLIVCSGLATGLVFNMGWSGYLLPLLLIPFLLQFTDKKSLTVLRSFAVALSFFTPFLITILWWFTETDPSKWAGINGLAARAVTTSSLLFMVTMLNFASLFFGYIAFRAQKHLRQFSLKGVFFIAAGWVVMEWLRSLIFSIVLYAPAGSIGDYWNFGSLGLGLSNTVFFPASRFIGLYGLTFITVIISIGLINAFRNKAYKLLLITLLLSLVVFSVAHLLYKKDSGLTINTRTLNMPTGEIDFDQKADIINETDNKKDLVVLPEYSGVFLPDNSVFSETYIKNVASNQAIIVDVETDVVNAFNRYGELTVRDKDGQVMEKQRKKLLIPTGEYLPYFIDKLFKAVDRDDINILFNQQRKLLKGDDPHPVNAETFSVGPVACSGILARTTYRQLTKQGSDILTNSSSLRLFNGSKAYFNQSYSMAQFHAVANARPYIQATKGAPVIILSKDGSSFSEAINYDKNTFIDTAMQIPTKGLTLYTRLGELILIISLLYCAWVLLLSRVMKFLRTKITS